MATQSLFRGALGRLEALIDTMVAAAGGVAAQLGPPPLASLLAELRGAACEATLTRYRPATRELAQRLHHGDADARQQWMALADAALAEMRAEVAAHGVLAGAFAAADRRFHAATAREHLDDPDLEPALRRRIMANLDAFNRCIGAYESFHAAAMPLLDGAARVLDLAAGQGGFMLHLARSAPELELTASDIQGDYLALGEAVAIREQLAISFAVQDALDLSNLEAGAFDVITCTQSLHHFTPGMISLMFMEATRVAGRGVVFIDGCRSALSGALLVLLGAVRYRDGKFLHDSWVSVRRFFVPQELELLARLTPGIDGIESQWLAPGHCLMRWRR